jgi:chaperone required for assembly of F1-ATPase
MTLRRHDDALSLSALHTITTLTGSALLSLAFAERHLTMEEVWSLAHLDEDWTIEHWGSDAEAEQRRADRFVEYQAATDVFSALRS